MRIGFDAKRAFHNRTGLGNYSRATIRALAKNYPQDEWHLFADKIEKANSVFANILSSVFIHSPENFFDKQFPAFWRSRSIGNDLYKNNIELYHGLSNEIPFGLSSKKIKTIVTIHDLIFLRHPEWYSFFDRKMYDLKSKHAVLNADAIIAVSEQTKHDIVEFYKTPEERIRVIYTSVNNRGKKIFSLEELNFYKNKLKLPNEFVLYVGTIEARKNVLTLVKAISLLQPQNKGIPLIIIGRRTKYFELVKNYITEKKLSDLILIPEIVPDDELQAYYQSATIFAYPSLYEGFGLPVAEALYFGIPVITSRGGCLEEAGGLDSYYADPQSPEEWAFAIEKIRADKNLQLQMKTSGLRHVSKFNEENFAKSLYSLYKEILK
jgi:glycosyltransferase involved in cell wall biosynthesis